MYSKTQETRAWVNLMIYGTFSIVAVICLNIIAAIFEQYWGYGVAGAFYWYSREQSYIMQWFYTLIDLYHLFLVNRSVGFVFQAKFYKSMVIRESNDGNSLRIYFPVVESLKPGCLAPNSLDHGIIIEFDNVVCYRVHHVNPFSGCGQMTGSFADGCCGDYIPIGFNINERDGCCSKRWKHGQNMVEFQLQEPFTYNECGCLCAERHANIIRVSTEDLDGLVGLLQAKYVKQSASSPAMKDTVALKVDQGDSYGNLDDA